MATNDELRGAIDVARNVEVSEWPEGWESLRIVAKAYIAEHPADDGEGIDEAWLRSIGFERRCADQFRRSVVVVYLNPISVGVFPSINPCERWWQCDGATTRGDVRRLLAALKIEPKSEAGK